MNFPEDGWVHSSFRKIAIRLLHFAQPWNMRGPTPPGLASSEKHQPHKTLLGRERPLHSWWPTFSSSNTLAQNHLSPYRSSGVSCKTCREKGPKESTWCTSNASRSSFPIHPQSASLAPAAPEPAPTVTFHSFIPSWLFTRFSKIRSWAYPSLLPKESKLSKRHESQQCLDLIAGRLLKFHYLTALMSLSEYKHLIRFFAFQPQKCNLLVWKKTERRGDESQI